METQDFLKPRLVGDRFDGHTLPLEILKDFSALEEMIVEVAKWQFLKDHPQSKRVKRNFSDGLELHLAKVEPGSAIPVILLTFSQLVAPANVVYFEQAKDAIIESMAQAEQGVSPTLPINYLSYFDRFGRGLRVNESIEFSRTGTTTVVYTPKLRKQLIKLSKVEEWTEEIQLRGRISEADISKNSFQMELRNGTRLQSPWAKQHRTTVLEALTRYESQPESAFVLIQGVVKKDSRDRLVAIESVEHISALDPLDVTLWLEELKELKDGWLDGKGLAPRSDALDMLAQHFDLSFDANLRLPYLYPTAEGGIQAEWSLPNDWEASLEIDLTTYQASFQALNVQTHETKDGEINLKQPENWKLLNEWLTAIGGVEV